VKFPALPELSKMSSRERLLTALVILCVSAVLLDRFVLGPWWRHTHQVRQEIERLEADIRAYDQLLTRRPQVLAEVEAYSTYIRQVDAGQVEMAELLREIEAMGKGSGMILGEVKPLSLEEREGPLQEEALEVHYSGSLKQWIHFIYLIQTSRSMFHIERAIVALQTNEAELLEGSLRLSRKTIKAKGKA